jgi:hypothetical protein
MLEKLKQYEQQYGAVAVTTKREDHDDAKLERWVDQ